MPKTLIERFEAQVWPEALTGCWLWGGALASGYGRMKVDGRVVQATAVSWELYRGGPPPDGVDLCHYCDNPACVNPAHLFLGTRRENMADASKKGRLGKLTSAQVIAIRESDDSHRALAARFGIARSLVSDIKAGRLHRFA